jgi:polysaccharide export outer membrane protein
MFCAIIFSGFLISGCASTGKEEAVTAQAAGAQGAGTDYKIGASDVLEITVYGEEGLIRPELVVRPDGKISFPLAGDIQVGGMTTAQAKELLEEKLREYIPGAVAAVSVKMLGSLQYYVVGKVNKPGMFNVSKPVTVLQALALAGGLTIFADEKNIQVVRNQDGKVTNLPFNYKAVKNGRDLEQNIVLERGDTVVVP